MLERFKTAKQKEIAQLRATFESGKLAVPDKQASRGFMDALISSPSQGLAIIAEYKRASPSRGIIREDLPIEDVAKQYATGGARAISILTEEDWFQGDFNYLERAARVLAPYPNIPLLRKDFIFDALQVKATANSPAAALLLIVKLTPNSTLLRDLREEAESYGLDCVVEVFDAHDLDLARESGAKIIQVNARDLNTLKVDRNACLELAKTHTPQNSEIWIAASGMDKGEHLQQAIAAGFKAALIGTALMSEESPGQCLKNLLHNIRACGNAD